MAPTRSVLSALLFLTLGLAGCGGGGDDATPPPAGSAVTIAAGGTVTSGDGKLQLIVPANSASAEGTATITKATPPADVLANPSYVPDSLYAYSGPDLEFSPPANWELASPQALAAGSSVRKSALATSRNDIDVEQMCQGSYAQGRGQAPKAVWVSGDNCPATCTKERGANTGTRTARSFCAPASTLSRIPMAEACPAGTSDASAEPAWSTWAADNSMRVCEPTPTIGAALLGSSAQTATTSCAIQNGSYVCKPSSVRGSGNVDGFGVWDEPDTVPPNSASHGFYTFEEPAITQDPSGNGYRVAMVQGGGYELKFRPRGNGENELLGLYAVRLYELIGFYAPPNGVFPQFEKKLVWYAPSLDPANGFQGLCCNTLAYIPSGFVVVPFYASSGPAVRYFQAEAADIFGNIRRSSVLRVARTFATAPTIASFTANPNTLPIGGGGGATTLVWEVNGATTVNILPSIGNVVNPSNGSAVAVVTATTVFTLTATNSFGQTSSANVIVTVAQDTTPPVVTLASTAASVIVPAQVTLTASASDAIGVVKVEFYRGATLIATDTTAPHQHSVSFGAADVGPVSFTARAYDAAGNAATSTPVVVSVTDPPGNGDTYASPTGVDTGNATCVQATPCLTIAKAASLAQPNKTVWLLNGEYKVATQPVPIVIPASRTLRAVNAGLAGVGQGIVLQGSGSVIGIVVRRNGFFAGDQGYIQASSGTIVLDGVRVIGSALTNNGIAAITLSGTAQATMTPGNIADYADQLAPAGQGQAPYATLADSARLTVNGGLFGGAALGGSADAYPKTGAFTLSGTSRLDLDNVVLNVDAYGVVMNGGATQLFMTSSLLHANANSGFGAGIHVIAGTAQITLVASSISGFAAGNNRGISVGPVGNTGQPGAAATVSLSSASVIDNDVGVWVADGATPSSLTLTGSNAVVSANTFGGVVCHADCNIDIAGGEISENGTQNPALVGGFSFYGGVWLGAPTKSYFLKLRNVQVIDNKSLLGGNSNQPGNSGITMAGSASSGFDLGSTASPGGNVFAGNTTGSETRGLNVGVAPGITVRAVGNTFIPGTQGANAQGKYQLGTAPCGPSSCDLTSTGSGGANFRITSGTLRLAE